ncbi:MAG TPA: TolC family protein [Roseomonas sp.]|jgi:outer membrane protein TolC
MFRPIRCALAAGLLAPLAAWAQDAQRPATAAARPPVAAAGLPLRAPALTLPEAEALLVERNLAVVAARQGVEIARAQRLVADTAPAPTVGYSQTAGQVNEGGRFRNYYGARFLSPLNNASINLSLTIERGGKRELRNRLADEQVSVAEAQVLDALRGQVFTLRQNFIQGLQARANLEVAVANRATLDRTEALLSRQVHEGQIPEADLLRFQASRLPFAQDLAAAAQSYAASVAQVAALLGADATAAAPAPRNPRDPVAAALAPVPFDLRGRLDAPPLRLTREQLLAALPTRPDVVAAERGATAAGANTRLAEAGRSRDVSVSGSVTRTELSQDLPNATRPLFGNTTLGVGVSIPIFTSRLTEGNVGIAAGQQRQARAQADGVLAGARADFATAWASYEQARTLLDLTTSQALRRAEDAYRSTDAAYQAGGRSLLDMLDALRTVNATRVSANTARASLLLALAGLEQASGAGGIMPRP